MSSELHVESIEQARRRLDAGFFVPERSDAAVDHRRRRRLAEVVADRRQHDRGEPRAIEIVVSLPRLVDHHQRVNPDVAFWMPFGLLRAVDERVHLGQKLSGDADLAREREADRRALRLEQQLLDFAPDPLGRQIVERDTRQIALVCSSAVSSKRAANCSARRTRSESSANGRRIDDAQDGAAADRSRPWNGSTYSSVSGSHEMALMVKSRRRAASSKVIDGSPVTTNPL